MLKHSTNLTKALDQMIDLKYFYNYWVCLCEGCVHSSAHAMALHV